MNCASLLSPDGSTEQTQLRLGPRTVYVHPENTLLTVWIDLSFQLILPSLALHCGGGRNPGLP